MSRQFVFLICVFCCLCSFQRPASQTTSIKVEPGSVPGSNASVKRAVSECSRQEISTCSVGQVSPRSPSQKATKNNRPDQRKSEDENSILSNAEGENIYESSFSSLYSFVKTDKSDASMRSATEDAKDSSDPDQMEAAPGSIREKSSNLLRVPRPRSPRNKTSERSLREAKSDDENGNSACEGQNLDDSSFYSGSSFLKTDESMKSSHEDGKYLSDPGRAEEVCLWPDSGCGEAVCSRQKHLQRKDPPWLESVVVTPELMYEYEMESKEIRDVLNADLEALKAYSQPGLANDQLGQLYYDLEVEGQQPFLYLEEGTTSSSSEDTSSQGSFKLPHPKGKKKRRGMAYGRMSMIFEENAPLPPPEIY